MANSQHTQGPGQSVFGIGQLIEGYVLVPKLVGDKLADKIPMKLVHSIAAAIFALLGVSTLMGAGAGFGF